MGSGCDNNTSHAGSAGFAEGVNVVSAFAFPNPPGAEVGVAYVSIANGGPGGDRLVSAESPGVGKVELHATIEDDGVVRMEHRHDGFPIAAGETLTMEPGGNHLMLMSIRSALVDGGSLPVTLHFEKGGSREIDIPVSASGTAQPCNCSATK